MTVQPSILVNTDRLVARAAKFSFRNPTNQELVESVLMAEELLDDRLATPTAIEETHNITGMTAWVTGNPIEGMYLIVPLSRAGERALRLGTFNPGSPSSIHLCHHGEPCFGLYVGVYAGRTHQARKTIMQASAILRVEVFGEVPCFARGATEDGIRSMNSLGFEPVRVGGLPDLYVQEALLPASLSLA